MDLRGNIPTFLHIDDGKSYDSDILDVLLPEAGAIYVMDRGYMDFARLHRLTAAAAFFIMPGPKSTLKCRRLYLHRVDKSSRSSMRHRPSRSSRPTPSPAIPTSCAACAIAIPRPANGWCS